MGINTGILNNATPLSSTRIKELERRVLQNGHTFAYLDESGKLCFMGSSTPEAIKELAWDNAYMVTDEQGSLVRAEYKKDSLKTFYLNKTSTKASLSDNWLSGEVLEGSGAEYYTIAPSVLSFRSTAPLNDFKAVQVNGQVVDPSSYTLEEGSTIVKLSTTYLNTLEDGEYNIAVVSDNKTVTGIFAVSSPKMDPYGFYYELAYWSEDLSCGLTFHDDNSAELLLATVDDDDNHITGFSSGALGTYYVEDGTIYIKLPDENGSAVEMPLGTISSDSEIVSDALGGTFILVPNIISDEGCVYVYQEATADYAVFGKCSTNTVGHAVKIKTSLNNCPVTTLPDNAFGQDNSITHVYIPGSILSVSASAFYLCENLESATIGSGVTSIGDNAFYGCISLKELLIPSSVQTIGRDAFAGCTALKSAVLPGTLVDLGRDSFDGCTSLEEVFLPEGLIELASYTFGDCTSLTNIVIPSSVRTIGAGAFACSGLNSILIPEGVTFIGSHAFEGCESLTRVDLPLSLTKLNDSPIFRYCKNLASVNFAGTCEQLSAIENTGYLCLPLEAPVEWIQCSDGRVRPGFIN